MLPNSFITNAANYKVSQNNLLGIISLPANYWVSFDMQLFGNIDFDANVIHLTASNQNAGGSGGRIPIVNFLPNSNAMNYLQVIAYSGSTGTTSYLANPSPSFPLNVWITVKVNIANNALTVTTSSSTGSLASVASTTKTTIDATRPSYSQAYLYASNPWMVPALVFIRNVVVSDALDTNTNAPSPPPAKAPVPVPTPAPTQQVTYCSDYVATNAASALQNYVVCSVYACAGQSFTVQDCNSAMTGPGSGATGSQFLRLLDANQNTLATNSGACGTGASLTYTPPAISICQNYLIYEGCTTAAQCSGTIKVSTC